MEEMTINLGNTEDVNNFNNNDVKLNDKFIVNVEELKSMIAMAKKIANYNPNDTISQVLNIKFSPDGIKMNASNVRYTFQSVNTKMKFTQSLEICVDIKAFGDFINNLDVPEIELTYNETSAVTTINMPTGGQFNFPQRVDEHNVPIVNILTYDVSYEDMIPFDYDKFINVIKQAKPVREFAPNSVTELNSLRSTYFGNIVVSSDSSYMFMQDNQTALNKGFSMSDELCNVLSVMQLDTSSCRVGYVDVTANILGLTISDGKTTICGPVEKTTILPIDACNKFWNTNFDIHITINTKVFTKTLKQLMPFLNWSRKDGDIAIFNINTDTVLIETSNGVAKDYVDIINESNYSNKIYLNIGKLYKFVQTIKSETFEIAINEALQNQCICLVYDEYKCVVAQTYPEDI